MDCGGKFSYTVTLEINWKNINVTSWSLRASDQFYFPPLQINFSGFTHLSSSVDIYGL